MAAREGVGVTERERVEWTREVRVRDISKMKIFVSTKYWCVCLCVWEKREKERGSERERERERA